jgi:hypothetical protein
VETSDLQTGGGIIMATRLAIGYKEAQMNGGFLLALFIGLVLTAAIGAAVYSVLAGRKRREELLTLSRRLGLGFSPGNNYELANRFGFLNQLVQGDNRYAFNVVSGIYRENPVLVFDYHYETHSNTGKGNHHTQHHYFSFFILSLPVSFPELRITHEGLLSKIAQALGYADIDFESAEFSRAFCVRSKDRKFAYDVCNPRMIEFLLANRDLSVEIERTALALAFNQRLSPAQIESNLQRLLEIRLRLPDYLLART